MDAEIQVPSAQNSELAEVASCEPEVALYALPTDSQVRFSNFCLFDSFNFILLSSLPKVQDVCHEQ